MSPMQVHAHRLMVERYCVTPCTLYRGGALRSPQPTMRDGSPLRCRIKDDKQTRIPSTEATQTMMRWLISLPNDVDVQEQDHLRTSNREYVLAPIANPDSDSPRNKCYAYALWPLDAQGTPGSPLYLRFNAVVTTKAAGVIKLSNVPAMIGEPDARALANFGGIVKHVVKVAPQADVNNVRPGDQLYIQSWGANAVDTTKPSYVIQENPDGPLGMEFHRLVISDKQQR